MEKFTQKQGEAKDLRNRAFTYPSNQVNQIREAGRHAYSPVAP